MKAFNIDHQRRDRLGFPEVVFGEPKSTEVLVAILEDYQAKQGNALVTRVSAAKAAELESFFPKAFYDKGSGIFMLQPIPEAAPEAQADIGLVAAGTSDAFVVNEAYYTLQFFGTPARRIVDVGVSGIHRLLNRQEELRRFQVLVVFAGFEGALPSVVGGLFSQPIIAVPTSVGYGVSEKGGAALNAMLASCANGITVVNINNGYGAAVAAYRILQQIQQQQQQAQ